MNVPSHRYPDRADKEWHLYRQELNNLKGCSLEQLEGLKEIDPAGWYDQGDYNQNDATNEPQEHDQND